MSQEINQNSESIPSNTVFYTASTAYQTCSDVSLLMNQVVVLNEAPDEMNITPVRSDADYSMSNLSPVDSITPLSNVTPLSKTSPIAYTNSPNTNYLLQQNESVPRLPPLQLNTVLRKKVNYIPETIPEEDFVILSNPNTHENSPKQSFNAYNTKHLSYTQQTPSVVKKNIHSTLKQFISKEILSNKDELDAVHTNKTKSSPQIKQFLNPKISQENSLNVVKVQSKGATSSPLAKSHTTNKSNPRLSQNYCKEGNFMIEHNNMLISGILNHKDLNEVARQSYDFPQSNMNKTNSKPYVDRNVLQKSSTFNKMSPNKNLSGKIPIYNKYTINKSPIVPKLPNLNNLMRSKTAESAVSVNDNLSDYNILSSHSRIQNVPSSRRSIKSSVINNQPIIKFLNVVISQTGEFKHGNSNVVCTGIIYDDSMLDKTESGEQVIIKILRKTQARSISFIQPGKEFEALKFLYKAGISVPRPIHFFMNYDSREVEQSIIVMDLIKGVTLRDWINKQSECVRYHKVSGRTIHPSMTIETALVRLQLAIELIENLQKLDIFGVFVDCKPRNIMVSMENNKPKVTFIDIGGILLRNQIDKSVEKVWMDYLNFGKTLKVTNSPSLYIFPNQHRQHIETTCSYISPELSLILTENDRSNNFLKSRFAANIYDHMLYNDAKEYCKRSLQYIAEDMAIYISEKNNNDKTNNIFLDELTKFEALKKSMLRTENKDDENAIQSKYLQTEFYKSKESIPFVLNLIKTLYLSKLYHLQTVKNLTLPFEDQILDPLVNILKIHYFFTLYHLSKNEIIHINSPTPPANNQILNKSLWESNWYTKIGEKSTIFTLGLILVELFGGARTGLGSLTYLPVIEKWYSADYGEVLFNVKQKPKSNTVKLTEEQEKLADIFISSFNNQIDNALGSSFETDKKDKLLHNEIRIAMEWDVKQIPISIMNDISGPIYDSNTIRKQYNKLHSHCCLINNNKINVPNSNFQNNFCCTDTNNIVHRNIDSGPLLEQNTTADTVQYTSNEICNEFLPVIEFSFFDIYRLFCYPVEGFFSKNWVFNLGLQTQNNAYQLHKFTFGKTITDILDRCLQLNPKQRPSYTYLRRVLKALELILKITLKDKQNNPKHVSESHQCVLTVDSDGLLTLKKTNSDMIILKSKISPPSKSHELEFVFLEIYV